jgi:lipopolysaccharide export system permease protein
MKKLDSYILKEMIAPFLGSVFVWLVLLVGQVLYDSIDFITQKRVPFFLVLQLIFFRLPFVIGKVLPLSILFGTSLAVNRLGRDSEITAIRIAGVPLWRLFMPIFVVGILSSGVALWLSETVTPWATTRAQQTMQVIWGLQPIPPIQQGVYFESEGYHFYVERVEHPNPRSTLLRNVMIYESAPPGSYPTLIVAKTAAMKNNLWVLSDGTVHKLGPDGLTQYEMTFSQMQLNLKRIIDRLWQTQRSTDEMNIRDLQHQIEVFHGVGQEVTAMKVDLNFKLALPLSCLIFVLCAAPLSLKFSRMGGYSGVLIGIVIFFLYWNNIILGKSLGDAGLVPPGLAGWSQNIIFGLVGLFLLWREE